MHFFRHHLFLVVLVVLWLAACGAPAPVTVPTATSTVAPTETPTPTITPAPTATLPPPTATPFVVNYEMVDTDKDGKISQAEFQAGCSKGWIQKPDASTVNQMKGNQ